MSKRRSQIPIACSELTALDRVKIEHGGNLHHHRDVDDIWFYFQRFAFGSKIALASPSGFLMVVPHDRIRIIQKRTPLTIRVHRTYTNRQCDLEWIPSKLLSSYISSVNPKSDPDYKLQLDGGDICHKAGRSVIHPDDWNFLASQTDRDRMPVIGKYRSLADRAKQWPVLGSKPIDSHRVPSSTSLQAA